MKTDKLLIGIVVGIVILVIVALVVTLSKPEATYQPDDTPEGVVHNYLLALQKEDYDKAYGYLSRTLKGYPGSETRFIEDIESDAWRFRLNTSTTLSITEEKIAGNNATVIVNESRFRGGDLFNSGQSSQVFEVKLHQVAGEWRIFYSQYYFAWCWSNEKGCQ